MAEFAELALPAVEEGAGLLEKGASSAFKGVERLFSRGASKAAASAAEKGAASAAEKGAVSAAERGAASAAERGAASAAEKEAASAAERGAASAAEKEAAKVAEKEAAGVAEKEAAKAAEHSGPGFMDGLMMGSMMGPGSKPEPHDEAGEGHAGPAPVVVNVNTAGEPRTGEPRAEEPRTGEPRAEEPRARDAEPERPQTATGGAPPGRGLKLAVVVVLLIAVAYLTCLAFLQSAAAGASCPPAGLWMATGLAGGACVALALAWGAG